MEKCPCNAKERCEGKRQQCISRELFEIRGLRLYPLGPKRQMPRTPGAHSARQAVQCVGNLIDSSKDSHREESMSSRSTDGRLRKLVLFRDGGEVQVHMSHPYPLRNSTNQSIFGPYTLSPLSSCHSVHFPTCGSKHMFDGHAPIPPPTVGNNNLVYARPLKATSGRKPQSCCVGKTSIQVEAVGALFSPAP